MRWGASLGGTAACALVATAAFAAPEKVTFGGTLINDSKQTSTSYLASYVYDPSQGSLTTTSEAGGLVTLSYTGPVQAVISFSGKSYVINGNDPNEPGDVIRSEETLLKPPSSEYIANANSDTGSLTNFIEVQDGKVEFTFGAYDQISNGNVVASYTLIPDSVSAAPEPSTWLLMIAGIGGIGLLLRQSKRTAGFQFKDAFSA